MNLVEREAELKALDNLILASRTGAGQVALVSGLVATGKTALLQALGERVADRGSACVTAAGSRQERCLPGGVLGQVLRSRALPAAVTRRGAELFDDPAFLAALGESGPEVGGTAARAFEELCSLLVDAAEQQPLVICVDDVHYSDAPSLNFLLFLVRRLKSTRICLVLSECSDPAYVNPVLHAGLLRQPGSYYLELAPLSPAGVAELLAECLGEPVPDPVAQACHRVSAGIPLLVRALADDYRAAAAAPRRTPQLAFGGAFSRAIVAMLYNCEPMVLRAAWAAAVLGDAAAPGLLAGLLDIAGEATAQSVSVLSSSGLLDGGRFRDDAVRAAVLRSMPAADRETMERRAAEVLHDHGAAADVVAPHIVAAGQLDAPWAAALLQEAAEQALAEDRTAVAISYLRRADDLGADPANRAATRFMLAQARWREDPVGGARYLPELVAAAVEGTLGRGMAPALVPHLLWQGRPGDAADVLAALDRRGDGAPLPGPGGPIVPGRKLAELRAGKHKRAELRAGKLWLALAYPGLAADARPGALTDPASPPPAPRLAASVGSARPPQIMQGAALLAAALTGKLEEGGLLAAEQILQGTRLDDSTLPAVVAAIAALLCADHPDRAAVWAKALLDDATARGVPTWQAVLRATCAMVEIRLGNLPAAQAHAEQALSILSPQGWGVPIGAPIAALLLATTAAGKAEQAAACLRMPVPDEMFQTPCGLMYLGARGRYYLSAGRPHAALADFQSCGDRMAAWGIDQPATLPWRSEAAQAYLRMGKDDEARGLVSRQLEMLPPGDRRMRGISLRVLAMTRPLRQRPALLHEAVDLLRDSADRLELARAYADLSQAHWRLGEHSRARRTAWRAHSLAEQCGAEPLKQAVQPQYGTAGTGASTGLDDLSAAEHRVAVLAANGYTNRQIASRLHVTVSTVEQHLTQVYKKLRVRRRADLPSELQLQAVPAGE